MELISSSTTRTGGGGGGPAPFLMKTYDMVDDTTTDYIISWSSSHTSFIVWDPQEFSRLLLPSYFKHTNFSSFIRQLNTYGFRKIDPERWEFANDDFIKDRKHLLKNIHRRKPIHSHSQVPPDPERAAFEEEIETLNREKNYLDVKVSGFKMHHCAAKSQLAEITQRICGMEQRQEKLLTYLEKAIQDTAYVEHFAQKIVAMDLTVYNKKRRLHKSGLVSPAVENNFEFCQHNVSNKFEVEISTAVSDMNLVSNNTHSSNEDWARPTKNSAGTKPEDMNTSICTLPFVAETVELSDTGTCLAFIMDPLLSDKVELNESLGLPSLQQNLVSDEEYGSQICSQLNLLLSSSIVQPNQSSHSIRATDVGADIGGSQGTRSHVNDSNKDGIMVPSDNTHSIVNMENSSEHGTLVKILKNHDQTSVALSRVNNQFWEQYLTERPGSSDAEVASSSYGALPSNDPEDGGLRYGNTSKTAKNLGKLTI